MDSALYFERALLGVAFAFLLGLSLAIVNAAFSDEQRPLLTFLLLPSQRR